MAKFYHLVIVSAAMLAVAGCATDRSFGVSPGITVTDLTELPAPEFDRAGLLSPLESVDIKVLQDDALSGTYRIDGSGMLDLPLIDAFKAAGLSSQQTAQEIARRLDPRFVHHPEVIVRSLEAVVPSISVGGEVGKPGSVSVTDGYTLMRAVNAAGGKTEYAKLSDVLVFRERDGIHYIGLYNLAAIQRGNYPDPALYGNDIVMVGDSPARRRLAMLAQGLSLLATSVILIDRVAN